MIEGSKMSHEGPRPEGKTVVQIELCEQYLEYTGSVKGYVPPWSGHRSDHRVLVSKIKEVGCEQEAKVEERVRRENVRTIAHYGGGTTTSIAEYLTLIFGTVAAASAFLKVVQPLLVQWMKNRAGRTIRLKKGDLEVTITGTDDADKVMSVLRELEDSERANLGSEGKELTPNQS